jgi:glycosyltransferase involved in cell wall biosynthesis
MRILIANDGLSDAGGVHAYLDAIVAPLDARGHQLGLAFSTDSGPSDRRLSLARMEHFRLSGNGRAQALARVRRWAPDVCFSHNMHDLSVDRDLIATAPVVKFMHGYFGTCISGLKMHGFPRAVACERQYGPACLALYYPRRCGQLSPALFFRSRRWAEAQRPLIAEYATVVVASRHMRDEYVRSGADAGRTVVNALFATRTPELRSPTPAEPRVVFLGRMTPLKGGDLLLRAVRQASTQLGRPIGLTMIGDGPQRGEWEALASQLGLNCQFTGWLTGDARWPLVRSASVLALPSVWPEPFGLVGLEAGALGVPAIATSAGGITEWLRDGANGVVVPAPATDVEFGSALASMLGDPLRLERLRAGALRVATEMSVDAHVSRLEAILARVARTAAV